MVKGDWKDRSERTPNSPFSPSDHLGKGPKSLFIYNLGSYESYNLYATFARMPSKSPLSQLCVIPGFAQPGWSVYTWLVSGTVCLWSEYAPGTTFHVGKKKFTAHSKIKNEQ